jgi:hypothetical protein
MSWWVAGTMAVSTGLNLYGQHQSKKAGERDAESEAKQREGAAKRSRAVGQREAEEERRQARLLSSSLQARAGGGGLDPGVVELEKAIAGEGEYRALTALYEGETGALGMEEGAAATRRSARARSTAQQYQMGATLLQGASQMYGRYAS